MEQKKETNHFNGRNLIFTGILVLAVSIAIVIAFLMMQPERSVANFCNVAKQEKATLTGDVSYEKRLNAYKQLEAAAPNDIKPDITIIRKGYDDIVKNPSNTLATGLGMSSAENRRTVYINTNCKDF